MSDHDMHDKDATTDAGIIAECKARFGIVEEAEGDNRVAALDDLSFADGNQWPDDVTNTRRNRPTPVINHCDTFLRRVVNNLKQLRPRMKAHPVGEGANQDVAHVINGLLKHIEYRSNASIAYDMAGESAVRMGWGYFRLIGEFVDEASFDQEIRIAPIRNPFQVYMDPAAIMPSGEDQMWCIMTGRIKRTLYKALYPRAPNAEWMGQAAGDQERDWESKEELRLAEYYRIRERPDVLYKMIDGTTVFASDLPDSHKEFIAQGRDGPMKRDSFKRQVEWYRINGETIADRRVLPGRYIPILRVEGNVLDLNGKVLRKGMTRNLKDPQRNFNYMNAAQIERLALAPKAPWVVASGQLEGHPEWYDANQKNYSTLVYEHLDGVPPPQRQPPVGVESGFAEAAQSAEHDLVAIAGMPHEPGQDSQGEVVSGKAIQRRQGISDQSHYQYFDNQTLAIAQCGRIILDWIPAYYDTPRMQRIIGDDDKPEMVAINEPQPATDENGAPQVDEMGQAVITIKNDLTVGKYDLVMDAGPGYQTQREEGAENLMALVGTPELGKKISDVGADLVVRSIDGPYMPELADRLAVTTPKGMDSLMKGLPKQAQAVVQTLQTQLQQSQAKIQELEMDLKHGLTKTLHQDSTKLAIANLNDDTKRHDTHTNAQVKIEDTHTRAQTALNVAEIREAGSMLNTHVEAAHNRVAAADALKAAEAAEKEPAK